MLLAYEAKAKPLRFRDVTCYNLPLVTANLLLPILRYPSMVSTRIFPEAVMHELQCLTVLSESCKRLLQVFAQKDIANH